MLQPTYTVKLPKSKMAGYQPAEIVDMIMILGECRNNFEAVSRLYSQRYLNRRHPSRVTIRDLTARAREGRLIRERRHHEYNENDVRVLPLL